MSFGYEFLVLALAGIMSMSCAKIGLNGSQLLSPTQTVLDEKESRTAAQKKIDSQLLYALAQKRGITKGVPAERIDIGVDRKGRALVDITANVTPEVTAQIRKLGGDVISDDASAHPIRARLALEKLEKLANRKDVTFIAPAAQAINNGVRPTGNR
jgi:hypothetical protein